MPHTEYEAGTVSKGFIGKMILGASSLPLELIEAIWREGQGKWQIVFLAIEGHRIRPFRSRRDDGPRFRAHRDIGR